MEPTRSRARGIGLRPSRGKAKSPWIAAGCLIAALGVGCGHVQAPLADYDAEGQRVMVKRAPRDNYVDTFTRFDKVAYEPGSTFTADRLSAEQQEIYDTYGHPEYVRKPFISTRGDKVDEWVYLRHNLLAQWVQGHEVFEGPVTDAERTLLDRGYPTFAWSDVDETGMKRQIWVYRDEVKADQDVVSFSDGKRVFQETKN